MYLLKQERYEKNKKRTGGVGFSEISEKNVTKKQTKGGGRVLRDFRKKTLRQKKRYSGDFRFTTVRFQEQVASVGVLVENIGCSEIFEKKRYEKQKI